MKKTTVLTILFISIIYNCYGQTLSDVIKTMPENIVWGITQEQKEEILTNPKDSIIIVSGNNLYNKYIRKELSGNYIKVQTSDVGDIQIKLLPLINNTNVICVVKSICKDFCDSNISFYTMDWIKIEDNSLFPKPEIKWFIKSDIDKLSDDYRNAIAVIDLLPIKLTLSPDSNLIQAELDIEKYLDEKNYTNLKIFLSDTPKILIWDKTKFR